ncbi:MAG: hypothetical protein K8R92_04955 [Planctomycetes bacterium]|nr:hypothetical protein [Planctomycetota bacterium]
MRTASIVSSVLALAFAGLANAAITGVGGSVNWLGVNPPSAVMGNLTGSLAYAWDEQTGYSSTALPVNLTAPGVYTGPTMNFSLAAGSFDSHMIHFDPGTPAFCSGSVTFSGPIIAVIYDQQLLTISDLTLGALTTTYDTGNPFRSFSSNALGFSIVAYSGNTLSFNFVPDPAMQMYEMRVLTHTVPAPGAAGLLAMTGLVGARRRRIG